METLIVFNKKDSKRNSNFLSQSPSMSSQGSKEVLAWAMSATAKLVPSAPVQRRPITRLEADKKYRITESDYDAWQPNLGDTMAGTVCNNVTTVTHPPDSTDYPRTKAKAVPQGVCKDFYETGYCRFGDACIYSHIREVDM